MRPRLHVLLCGGTGYLGGHILSHLKKKRCVVRLLVRKNKPISDSVKKLCADIVEVDSVTELANLKGTCDGIDCVISCLGKRSSEKAKTVWDIDHKGNMDIIQTAKEAGVKHFIFVTALGGDLYSHLIPQYEAREKVIEALREDNELAYTVFRSSLYFNELQDMFESARRGSIQIYGKGVVKINPIDGADLAEAIVNAAKHKDTHAGKIISIGGPEVLSFSEIASLAKQIGDNPSAAVKSVALSSTIASLNCTSFVKAFQMLPDLQKQHIQQQQRKQQQQKKSVEKNEDVEEKEVSEQLVAETQVGTHKLADYFKELLKGKLVESNGDRIVTVYPGLTYEVKLEIEAIRKPAIEPLLDIEAKEEKEDSYTRIAWKFWTEDNDISFGIFFQKNAESRRVTLQEVSRVNSHRKICSGKMRAEQAGTYIFKWDNTYSYFTKKVLEYQVWAINADKQKKDEKVLRDKAERERISKLSTLHISSGAYFRQAPKTRNEDGHVIFPQVENPSSSLNETAEEQRKYEAGFPELGENERRSKDREKEREKEQFRGNALLKELSALPNRFFSFWGIYDGHGGTLAVDYVTKNLHQLFVAEENMHLLQQGEYKEALKNTFLRADAELKALFEERKSKEEKETKGKEIEKAEQIDSKQENYQRQLTAEMVNEKADIGGTCAVVAFLIGRKLFVANVGDCEAILVKKRSDLPFVVLSEKHHASENPIEKKRIESMGGIFIVGRLFGILDVTRTLGDFAFKKGRQEHDFVSPVPYVREYDLDPCEDEFVILSSRGFWEELPYQRVIELVNKLRQEGKDAEEISQILTREAGNRDNMTVVLIILNWKLREVKPIAIVSQEIAEEEARLSKIMN